MRVVSGRVPRPATGVGLGLQHQQCRCLQVGPTGPRLMRGHILGPTFPLPVQSPERSLQAYFATQVFGGEVSTRTLRPRSYIASAHDGSAVDRLAGRHQVAVLAAHG